MHRTSTGGQNGIRLGGRDLARQACSYFFISFWVRFTHVREALLSISIFTSFGQSNPRRPKAFRGVPVWKCLIYVNQHAPRHQRGRFAHCFFYLFNISTLGNLCSLSSKAFSKLESLRQVTYSFGFNFTSPE